MRARVIALLCVGAGVLCSCSKDPGENGISAEVHIDAPTNHADTWTALEVILKDAGYTVEVGHWLVVNAALSSAGLPLELVATHKDGTKLDVTLVPDGVRVPSAPRESGGTKVLITEDMGMRGATANDVAKWLEDRQWPKLLKRLKEKVGR